MKSYTGQKRRSRPPGQGHRKRRRLLKVEDPNPARKLTWTDYKTLKQYETMGDMLDDMKVFGYRGAVEKVLEKDYGAVARNGFRWLTKDPPASWEDEEFSIEDLGGGRSKLMRPVLLHEPEKCESCGAIYLSCYRLKSCTDHDGLEAVFAEELFNRGKGDEGDHHEDREDREGFDNPSAA